MSFVSLSVDSLVNQSSHFSHASHTNVCQSISLCSLLNTTSVQEIIPNQTARFCWLKVEICPKWFLCAQEMDRKKTTLKRFLNITHRPLMENCGGVKYSLHIVLTACSLHRELIAVIDIKLGASKPPCLNPQYGTLSFSVGRYSCL